MSLITEIARVFFDTCENGRGWEACRPFCHDDALFDVQAQSLAELKTLQAYCEYVPQLKLSLPDARYVLLNLATDDEHQTVMVYALFCGTHTGDIPVPATGRRIEADYVFVMRFSHGKISRVTKVWNDAYSAKQLGWA